MKLAAMKGLDIKYNTLTFTVLSKAYLGLFKKAKVGGLFLFRASFILFPTLVLTRSGSTGSTL